MNRGRVGVAVLLVGLSGFVPGRGSAATTPAPSHLAFNEKDGRLVIVDEDGGHRRVVGGGRFAAFSDDGSTVYFADARPGFSSMPWSGGRARPVTPASACARFSLSPDHVHMTYDRGCDPKYGSEFVLSRLDGSDQHTLDDGDGGSTWSPDGRWLAWVGCRGLAGCPLTLVRMFDTLTGSVRQVSNGRLYGWSPNGDWLVVSDEEGGRDDVHHLVIQHADGSGRRTLPVTDPGGVSWAPDSGRLVAGEGSRLVVVTSPPAGPASWRTRTTIKAWATSSGRPTDRRSRSWNRLNRRHRSTPSSS
jgi:Tol biopolymer transport system component